MKVAIFLVYLILCSKQKDMHRVFCYHGAEHKTIFCYEAGLPLTVENVRIQPRHHPRCGTSFLFVVIIVSILCQRGVRLLVNGRTSGSGSAMHLLLLPLVVGITYEFNRWWAAMYRSPDPGPDRPRYVAAEFHHQRAGRLHDGGGHSLP